MRCRRRLRRSAGRCARQSTKPHSSGMPTRRMYSPRSAAKPISSYGWWRLICTYNPADHKLDEHARCHSAPGGFVQFRRWTTGSARWLVPGAPNVPPILHYAHSGIPTHNDRHQALAWRHSHRSGPACRWNPSSACRRGQAGSPWRGRGSRQSRPPELYRQAGRLSFQPRQSREAGPQNTAQPRMGGEPPSGSLPRCVFLRNPAQMPVGDDHDAFRHIVDVKNLVGLSMFRQRSATERRGPAGSSSGRRREQDPVGGAADR